MAPFLTIVCVQLAPFPSVLRGTPLLSSLNYSLTRPRMGATSQQRQGVLTVPAHQEPCNTHVHKALTHQKRMTAHLLPVFHLSGLKTRYGLQWLSSPRNEIRGGALLSGSRAEEQARGGGSVSPVGLEVLRALPLVTSALGTLHHCRGFPGKTVP